MVLSLTALIPLKEQFFNQQLLEQLNAELSSISLPILDTEVLLEKYSSLELLDRMHLTADAVYESIGKDFPESLKVILQLGPTITGFSAIMFPDIIERHGLEYPDISLLVLAQLTQYSSSEFAIRPFIKQDLKGVLEVMEEWSLSSNHHIRRLASEGSRYKLPWSFKIQEFIDQPELTSKIIRNLKQDEELYVRKSVANHLNDLSKEKPEFVLGEVTQWTKNKHSDWITKHALRTLVKSGNKDALKILGITQGAKVDIHSFSLKTTSLRLGEVLEFSCALDTEKEAEVNLDYVLHFLKANGKLSKKVFKLKRYTVIPGE